MFWNLLFKRSKSYCAKSKDSYKTRNFPEASQTLFGQAKAQMEKTVQLT